MCAPIKIPSRRGSPVQIRPAAPYHFQYVQTLIQSIYKGGARPLEETSLCLQHHKPNQNFNLYKGGLDASEQAPHKPFINMLFDIIRDKCDEFSMFAVVITLDWRFECERRKVASWAKRSEESSVTSHRPDSNIWSEYVALGSVWGSRKANDVQLWGFKRKTKY